MYWLHFKDDLIICKHSMCTILVRLSINITGEVQEEKNDDDEEGIDFFEKTAY